MDSMFAYQQKFTSLDLSGFDTSNVTDVSGMFRNCDSLETLNLSGWDFSKATINNPIYMRGCSQVTINLIKSELKDEHLLDQVTIIT